MDSIPAQVPDSRPLSPISPQLGAELRDSAVLLALCLALLGLFALVSTVLLS